MPVEDKVQTLRSLVSLLSNAVEVISREWEIKDQNPEHRPFLPSADLHHARQTIVGACGMLMSLVQEPHHRLMETALQYYSSRALHVAVEARLADILAEADPELGMDSKTISVRTGIPQHNLAQVLRPLCSMYIFKEIKPGYFANNETSGQMVNDEPFRSWLLVHGLTIYTASTKLPAVLFDTGKIQGRSSTRTAFQEALGTDLSFWEYLEQDTQPSDGTKKARREVDTFTLAMVGGGRVHSTPLYADYPWESLGDGTLVDVGAGVGGMSLDLAKQFPRLRFVLQDRPSVISGAEAVWKRELPHMISTNRVQFMAHDFFADQPVKGASVYLMRYIMHDWPDEQCITILSKLRDIMGPHSRILAVDQILHPTVGSAYLNPAPAPLPPNYGHVQLLSHMRDLNMLALFNGMERTPEDFASLAERAGLKMVKIWECRSTMGIAEMRRNDAP
ncbi:uncharacterized protein FIBRA_00645 [Fibroporia radiculosa]|uniref:Uncharacterized protein n=1 Tax=Fibroporia radiculosa TaxID=599839 RepID=J4G0I9_9APHY|nr:uncharacterized protein FIBRA_00645 [Fibroporia radiculosa]CCL98643.1 predicted protein [Fibroporia radiculosa]